MTHLNNFRLILRQHTSVIRNGITFTNIATIDLLIDDIDMLNTNDAFTQALLYFPELERSSEKNGKYLLFTCACGVADDGSWEGVAVTIDQDIVSWKFIGIGLQFHFTTNQYRNEISKIRQQLDGLDRETTLEPSHVDFPEHWTQKID